MTMTIHYLNILTLAAASLVAAPGRLEREETPFPPAGMRTCSARDSLARSFTVLDESADVARKRALAFCNDEGIGVCWLWRCA